MLQAPLISSYKLDTAGMVSAPSALHQEHVKVWLSLPSEPCRHGALLLAKGCFIRCGSHAARCLTDIRYILLFLWRQERFLSAGCSPRLSSGGSSALVEVLS